jgi:hypothetical protein
MIVTGKGRTPYPVNTTALSSEKLRGNDLKLVSLPELRGLLNDCWVGQRRLRSRLLGILHLDALMPYTPIYRTKKKYTHWHVILLE